MSSRAQAGQRAGCVATTKGGKKYIYIGLFGRSFYAHRLAWLYVTGEWPSDIIDHRNGDGTDNRFVNLREADAQLNAYNSVGHKRRPKGAALKPNGGWIATIRQHGKRKHLGTFTTAEDAAAAYNAAARCLHGEFMKV